MAAARAGAHAAQLREKAARIAEQLRDLYPRPPVPLNHESHFQLLVAVMLSAQTTDAKVNEVTPALFSKAPDAQAMARQHAHSVQAIIKSVGLAPTKAKNLVEMSKLLMERHGGDVPDTFEELEALPGVGHKTASVVMCQAFGRAAFPVDTHIHRLAQRWGLTCGTNVEKTEADLKALFPEDKWRDLHLQIIYFAREHCTAKRHEPAACTLCSWAAVPPYRSTGVSPLKAGQPPSTPAEKARVRGLRRVLDQELHAVAGTLSELDAESVDVQPTTSPSARKRSKGSSTSVAGARKRGRTAEPEAQLELVDTAQAGAGSSALVNGTRAVDGQVEATESGAAAGAARPRGPRRAAASGRGPADQGQQGDVEAQTHEKPVAPPPASAPARKRAVSNRVTSAAPVAVSTAQARSARVRRLPARYADATLQPFAAFAMTAATATVQ